MAFEQGHGKVGGRQKGTTNKRNQEIYDLAEELGCSPAKILMLFASNDFKSLGYPEYEEKLTKDGTVYVRTISPELRKAAASDLMPYLYGKRKPIDSNGEDSSDPLSDLVDALRERD